MRNQCKAYRIIVVSILCLLMPTLASAGMGLGELVDRAEKCGVPSESVTRVQKLAAAGTVSEEQAVSLLSPLLTACVEVLPVEPFEEKLGEGIAKNVAPPFIIRALEKRLAAYKFARELLLTTVGSATPDTLAIVGQGVDKGVPRTDFEAFASRYASVEPGLFEVGLAMLSLQGQAGFGYPLTRDILDVGLDKGTLSVDWRYFVRVILTARKRGIGDDAIGKAAIKVLEEGGPVSEVLTELGFTGRSFGGEDESE